MIDLLDQRVHQDVITDGAGLVDADAYARMAQRSRDCFATWFNVHKAAERLVEILQENMA